MKRALTVGVYDPKLIMQASPYPGDNVFAKGFEKNDYKVIRFDYRGTDDPNKHLLELVEAFGNDFDIIWFGKCERILPETIKKMRQILSGAVFCKWAADVRTVPTVHDLAHNQCIDYFFGTFGGDYLKKHLLPNMKAVASILTFTDSDFYKQINVSYLPSEYKTDILWTGRRGFGDNPIRNEVIDFLTKYEKANVKIAGLSDWLGSPDYQHYINGAKIGIGANSFNRKKYSSDRIGNYMACGTFYLAHYFEGIEEIFERGVELDWFKTIEEMEEKIDYYLSHEKERKQIAKNGKYFVLKHFDCKPLVANILNIIETGKSNYKWDEIYAN